MIASASSPPTSVLIFAFRLDYPLFLSCYLYETGFHEIYSPCLVILTSIREILWRFDRISRRNLDCRGRQYRSSRRGISSDHFCEYAKHVPHDVRRVEYQGEIVRVLRSNFSSLSPSNRALLSTGTRLSRYLFSQSSPGYRRRSARNEIDVIYVGRFQISRTAEYQAQHSIHSLRVILSRQLQRVPPAIIHPWRRQPPLSLPPAQAA